jgi:hypothetical protein
MPMRAQLVTSSYPLLNRLPESLRSAVLFYAPLTMHTENVGPGLPTFTRVGGAVGTWRDGASHSLQPHQPVFDYAGGTPLGLAYKRKGEGSRVGHDQLAWTSGDGFTLHDQTGSVACVAETSPGSGVYVAGGVSYDYGAGTEKEYTKAGLTQTLTGKTQSDDFHDGRLLPTPLNLRIRHVVSFNRILTDAEMTAVLTIMEAL